MNVFVLGPMGRQEDGRMVVASHTLQIRSIVDDIGERLAAELGREDVLSVRAPESDEPNLIVPHVMDNIEDADLVVIDLSGKRPDVLYEAGLIHALGLPYLMVFDDATDTLPFYFRETNVIGEFVFQDRFDPDLLSHATLRRRLGEAVGSPDALARLAVNRISDYYGYPIVHISAPTGLAVGYYMNMVLRFIKQDGFLGENPVYLAQEIDFTGRALDGDDDEAVRVEQTERQERRRVKLRELVVVIPPRDLKDTFEQDMATMKEKLDARGWAVDRVSILERPEATNRFGFGGMVLRQDPGIVLDIPRTLYTLRRSPRVRRLWDRQGARAAYLKNVERGMLMKMVEAFEHNLETIIATDARGQDIAHNRVHIVAMDRLVETLEKLVREP